MTTITEQITNLEATRAAKAKALEDLLAKGTAEGRSTDEAEAEEFDTLEAEVEKIDKDLGRFRKMEAINKAAAVPVAGNTAQAAADSRDGRPHIQVVGRNLPKGTVFTRLLGARYIGYKNFMNPADVAKEKFADTPEVERILRAAVAAGNTTSTTWAGALVESANAVAEFRALLNPATVIGRIPGLSRVPFNIKVPRGTADPTAYWVGEGAVKPVSAMAFDQIELLFHKVAGIVTMTEELMRFSSPSAETIVRDRLIQAIAYLTDRDFLDPTKAAVTGVSPASVTNGVTPIIASGTTADALRADLGNLIDTYLLLNMSVSGLVLVMRSGQAMRLSLMRNTLGQAEFPGISASGGNLEGIPVITTENIVATGGSPTDGYLIVAINAPEILLADDGDVTVDVSREASLQMDSAPDSPETASTILVSLWQRNLIGVRAERFITWLKARDGAVQYISNAKYSE